MRWFTADLHFGHTNIIRYCNRPFHSVAEMNATLVANWNTRVDDDDEVWVLGDVAMGRIDESLRFIAQLRGHKTLLCGNHDRCWQGHGERGREWSGRYLDAGFEQLVQGTVETSVGGHEVLAGHFPYEGDSTDEERFDSWRPIDRGRWLLHGHVHTSWRTNGRQINVGTDVWDYAPVAEQALVSIIDAS